MKKESIEKIKKLCNELVDRDIQLKINEKFLWIVLDKISNLKKDLIKDKELSKKDTLAKVIESLQEIEDLSQKKGCKRINPHD